MIKQVRKNLVLIVILVVAILLVLVLRRFNLDKAGEAPQEIFQSIGDEGARKVEEVTNLIPIEDTYFLPILNFHNIGEPPSYVSQKNRIWYVTDENFRSALEFIRKHKLEPIFLSELIQYLEQKQIPDNAIVLTFDDGAINFYTNAAPILREYNYKSNVQIMTGVGGKNFLSADHIKELFAGGLVEFQSHTRYHAYLTRIPRYEQRQELEDSKQYLEDLLGVSVEVIAYPFGLYNATIIELAKETGYKLGLTILAGHTQNINKPFEIKRFNVTNFSNLERIIGKE